MFVTHWTKGFSGKWYKFRVPVTLELELSLLTLFKSDKDFSEVLTNIVSEILEIPPPVVEDEFTGDMLTKIFSMTFPRVKEFGETSKKIEEVQLSIEKEGGTFQDSISKMLAFFSFHGRIQPSEVFRMPRATVEEILREMSELLEADKKFQFDISVVHALSMVFGESGSSSGSSNVKRKDTIDLSNLDDEGLSKLKGLKDFVRVENG